MTTNRNYLEMLHARRAAGKRVCVGLDPDVDKMGIAPDMPSFQTNAMLLRLCKEVVDETKDIALAYKPNISFFSRTGAWRELAELIRYIKEVAPNVPVILDFKRGDTGNTNKGYVGEAFDIFQADAITIHPYLGYEAMKPFLADPDKFAYVLCKTSNDGSVEFQDLRVSVPPGEISQYGHDAALMYEYVAWKITDPKTWNRNGNVGLVVGITYPEHLRNVRDNVGPGFEILGPGAGTQGGDVQAAVEAGGKHLLVSSSSSVMFAEDIRQAALDLQSELLAAEASLV